VGGEEGCGSLRLAPGSYLWVSDPARGGRGELYKSYKIRGKLYYCIPRSFCICIRKGGFGSGANVKNSLIFVGDMCKIHLCFYCFFFLILFLWDKDREHGWGYGLEP